MNRKRLYQFHSSLGIASGIFLVIIGLSGSLLVFAPELDQYFSPEQFRVLPVGERLSVDRLRQKLKEQLPPFVFAGWLLPEHSNRPDQIWVHPLHSEKRGEYVVLLDPFSGEIKGKLAENRSDSFYGWMLNLHYNLFMGNIGYFLTGIFGLIFCFQGISGIILYRNVWMNFFRLRSKESLRTFFSDLHKLAGVLTVLFNLILGFTGAWWGIRSTVEVLSQDSSIKEELRQFMSESISIDSLVRETDLQNPGFVLGFISFPHHHAEDPIVLYGKEKEENPLRSRFGSYFVFHSRSGNFIQKFELSRENYFYRFIDSFRPVHFGTFGGIFTKILWVVFGLAPGILSLTGFGIFISKRRMRNQRKEKILAFSRD